MLTFIASPVRAVRRRSALAAALVLLLAVMVTGPSPAPAGPPEGQIDPSHAVAATLPNGLRLFVIRDTIAPVVATTMSYLVGSNDDPSDIPGLAHAQEHMMYRGTAGLSTDQLSTIATALGGSFNAYTRPTVTQFQFTVPADDLRLVLHIEADRMRDVLDSQSEWADERGAIEQEVAMNETAPGSGFFREMERIAYAGTPYAHDGVGTKAAFDALTGARIHEFFRKWYAPNNAVLVVTGDVDPAAVIAAANAEFGAVPARAIPRRTPVVFRPIKRRVLVRRTTLPYPVAAVAYRLPGLRDPDFLPLFVLAGMLDAERSKLHELEAAGDALSTSFELTGPFPDGELALATGGLPPNADPRPLARKIEAVFAGYAKHGVPPELFEAAKRRSIADQERSRNSIASLSADWSDVIVIDHEPSIAREIELLHGVTREAVNRVLRKYFSPDRALVGILHNGGGSGGSAHSAPGQPGKEAPIPERAHARTLPQWASAALEIKVPNDLRVHPSDMTLSNGMRLIVAPERVSRTVSVIGAVDHIPSLDEPAGQDGVNDLLERLYAFGSMRADRNAYQHALDDIAASESGGTRFGVSLTSENFERGVALLAENELQPRFRPGEFAAARDSVAGSTAAILNGSHFVVRHLLDQRLYPASDPALRFATPQSVSDLTLDDVRRYFERAYRPERTTIVVIGDITPERARAAIERSFGGWHASGDAAPLDFPAVPLNAASHAGISPQGEQQDVVTMGELLGIKRGDPRAYALEVGNTIFGGGAAGPSTSRLFRDLRQDSGLVYAVDADLAIRRSRSMYQITFACAPQNTARARELIARDARALAAELVPGDELALAKAAMVRRIVLNESDEDTIGNELLDDSLGKRPLDESLIAARHYVSTSAADVRGAFADYVRPEGFVDVVEGP